MKAEILTIGDEILIGQIVNTNSVWLAQELNLIGLEVVHMATVADNEKAIFQAFDDALKRTNFVFVTGGLGPTKDDITKKAFANYFETPLVMDEEIFAVIDAYFSKRGRRIDEINSKQALVPKGSTVFRNAHGTAPGMWMKKNNVVFISMPGVPYEMKAMMTESIIPKILSENTLPSIYHRTVLTQGIGESGIAEIINDWEDLLIKKNIKLAYLPQPGLVRLRLSTNGSDPHVLKKNIADEIKKLESLIGNFIFGYENYGEEPPTIEMVVSNLLRQKKKTVSLAESCTGGYIASLFASIPGASEVFKGAIVPYSNVGKQELLQVDPDIFTTVGAVSRECAETLALNVLKKLKSDYSIAVSGIAGPTGGTSEKPVGTVWIAVANSEKVLAFKYQFGDNRQRNIISTGSAAINLLRKFMLKEL